MTNIELLAKKYLEDLNLTHPVKACFKKIFTGLNGLPLGSTSIRAAFVLTSI